MGSNSWRMRSNPTVEPLLSENADKGIAVFNENFVAHGSEGLFISFYWSLKC